MKIFVVGSGKLANAILTANRSDHFGEIKRWETEFQTLCEKAIIVHAGSGRQLEECFEFCSRTNSTFIELSTGLLTDEKASGFPLIMCPNTSILVLKTLNMLKTNGRYFENYEISITESHQSTKRTEPGTAYAFANALKFPISKIVSIRNTDMQQDIGIPKDCLDRHAYHKIVIRDGCSEVCIETKVLGHAAYASGVMAIIEVVLKCGLENRKYSILNLIEKNLL